MEPAKTFYYMYIYKTDCFFYSTDGTRAFNINSKSLNFFFNFLPDISSAWFYTRPICWWGKIYLQPAKFSLHKQITQPGYVFKCSLCVLKLSSQATHLVGFYLSGADRKPTLSVCCTSSWMLSFQGCQCCDRWWTPWSICNNVDGDSQL